MINNSEPKYFTIYRLKPLDPSDNGYVCKFDERKLFRKAISAPGLFYVFTKVKLQPKSEAFILLSVWKKEKRTWRILTLSVDQD